MKNQEHSGKQDQLEKHSLPGTNQAGKARRPSEETGQEGTPGRAAPQHQDGVEEHSLPGTNQAGKGPNGEEENDA